MPPNLAISAHRTREYPRVSTSKPKHRIAARNTSKAKLLVIDDESTNFDVIEAHLYEDNYTLHYAPNAEHALQHIDSIQPDVILLDVMMPGMDGIECCRRLRARTKWKTIPIIIVTVLDSKETLTQCFDAGANDYITKPVSRLELRARVDSMLQLQKQYRQIQQLCAELKQANQSLSTSNSHLEEEVLERTRQLEQIAFFDTLTNLPNRAYLLQALHTLISSSNQQNRQAKFALLYVDCDHFQLVNGSLGYEIGDELLLAITERLQGLANPSKLLTRIGPDEFCILLYGEYTHTRLEQFINTVQEAFLKPFWTSSCELYITASIGVVTKNSSYQRAEDVLRDADTALNSAKRMGKGKNKFFEPQMHNATKQRLQLETDLRTALRNNEFVLHYQPIVQLNGGHTVGFEALARWEHPERGQISPGIFIPCAEETGMIVPIGVLVLELACKQLAQWETEGWKGLIISVNLSTRQFSYPNLLRDIDTILERTQVNPRQLKLEITESALMDNPHVAVELTRQIRQRNIQLSIDDFGTGYSSLGYLTQFPVDTIKLDRSFTIKIDQDTRSKAVVEAVVALGHALGMGMIAEGIETESHLNKLRQMGCPYGQGYYFAKPMSATDATQWLTQNEKIGV